MIPREWLSSFIVHVLARIWTVLLFFHVQDFQLFAVANQDTSDSSALASIQGQGIFWVSGWPAVKMLATSDGVGMSLFLISAHVRRQTQH